MENIRLTLHVPQTTVDQMVELAGGERKKSAYIRDLLQTIYEKQNTPSSDDLDSVRYQLQGIYAQLSQHTEQLRELQAERA